MKRRNCAEVITEMIKKVPGDRVEFLKDLMWNFEDSLYKAPEETLQWERTMRTLIKHIPSPAVQWEFDVLSIFTTKSVEQLKLEFDGHR